MPAEVKTTVTSSDRTPTDSNKSQDSSQLVRGSTESTPVRSAITFRTCGWTEVLLKDSAVPKEWVCPEGSTNAFCRSYRETKVHGLLAYQMPTSEMRDL